MIRNEISKIVKSPYMWGVLLFCILINCGILCFENTEDFSSSQYKKAVSYTHLTLPTIA